MTKTMKSNEETVKLSAQLLKENTKWKVVYSEYAEAIKKNSASYKEYAKKFRKPSSLIVYTSIGRVKSSYDYIYDLRFGGQSVGKIEGKEYEQPFLTVSEDQAKGICKILGREKFSYFNKVSWSHDNRAKEFRKLFNEIKPTKNLGLHSKEHRIESKILEEFGKSDPDKLLRNIQPIRLGGMFFQFITPLKASTHEPVIYASRHGGGIDILARVTHKNNERRIAVIELKDENKPSEPQAEVMKQALIYATFIAYLLRSESGNTWWNIFEESNNVPTNLHLDVVTLMPKGNSNEGSLDDIAIKELNATLHLYTLYYGVNTEGNPNNLEGKFDETLKK